MNVYCKKTDRGDTNCWDVGATKLWPMSNWIPLLLSTDEWRFISFNLLLNLMFFFDFSCLPAYFNTIILIKWKLNTTLSIILVRGFYKIIWTFRTISHLIWCYSKVIILNVLLKRKENVTLIHYWQTVPGSWYFETKFPVLVQILLSRMHQFKYVYIHT